MVYFFRTRFNSTNPTRIAAGSIRVLGYRVMNQSNIPLPISISLTLQQSDRRILYPLLVTIFEHLLATRRFDRSFRQWSCCPLASATRPHVASRRLIDWWIETRTAWITRAYSVCIRVSALTGAWTADRPSYNLAKCCIVHYSCARHTHTNTNSSFKPVDLRLCFFHVCANCVFFFLFWVSFFAVLVSLV